MVREVKDRARSLAAVQSFPLFLPLPAVMGECSQGIPRTSVLFQTLSEAKVKTNSIPRQFLRAFAAVDQE